MKQGFVILDHPSDLGIEACGRTLEEAFEAAAAALMSIILDRSSVDCAQERRVEIAAADREQLLVKWLGEILYLYDGLRFAPVKFRIQRCTATSLSAVVSGEPFSASKHRTNMDVKGVTYHRLSVGEAEGGATVRVFLDI
jgi:SHS2 domain-containing protein